MKKSYFAKLLTLSIVLLFSVQIKADLISDLNFASIGTGGIVRTYPMFDNNSSLSYIQPLISIKLLFFDFMISSNFKKPFFYSLESFFDIRYNLISKNYINRLSPIIGLGSTYLGDGFLVDITVGLLFKRELSKKIQFNIISGYTVHLNESYNYAHGSIFLVGKINFGYIY